MNRSRLFPFALAAAPLAQAPAPRVSAPMEHGAIAWERDFPAAQARARAEQRPMLVLFQEVPG